MNRDDFGFTFEEAPGEALVVAKNTVENQSTLLKDQDALIADLRKLNREMYNKILILLNNLKKNPEKAVINWPGRADAIEKFINELNELKALKDPNERTKR